MTDTENTDVQATAPDPEVEGAPGNTTEASDQTRSIDDELDAILADFRSDVSAKPETEQKTDVSLEDRLKKIEENDRKRAESDYNQEIKERLDRAVDDMIKAVPDLKKITPAGVRGNLIGDLYQDPALVSAFMDKSDPKVFQKLGRTLAKRYAADIPKDEQLGQDDTAAVLAEVRGVSTKAPPAPDPGDFARTASSEEWWAKYGGIMSGR